MLLGPDVMPEIALITMLPKTEAPTWENNQVKQRFRAKCMTQLVQSLSQSLQDRDRETMNCFAFRKKVTTYPYNGVS